MPRANRCQNAARAALKPGCTALRAHSDVAAICLRPERNLRLRRSRPRKQQSSSILRNTCGHRRCLAAACCHGICDHFAVAARATPEVPLAKSHR